MLEHGYAEQLSPTQSINLFFALKPDPKAAAEAHSIARRHRLDRDMSGWPLAHDRLHVTLLSVASFVGSVPPAFMDLALGIGDAVHLSPFRVTLDRAVSFARRTGKRPYVLLGGEGVADVMPLHCGLVGAMFRTGLDMPLPTRFNPHMTLLYDNAHRFETAVAPVSWIAKEFVLIESHVGQTRHVERGRWQMR